MGGPRRQSGRGAAVSLRYLALGDSYTVGEGVERAQTWPYLLAGRLRAAGVPLAVPAVIATTGWTTWELDAAIDAEQAAGRLASSWDLVSLLIGVNDQYRGQAADGYASRFDALLARAAGFAGGRFDRVLVLSIPDWGATPFGRASGRDGATVAAELDAYNAAARTACATRGAAFVDITAIGRARAEDPQAVTGDGLHPSASIYRAWADAALPTARALLDADRPSAARG